MLLFNCKPKIHNFEAFREFAEEFNIGEGDLVFTLGSLYEPIFKPLNLKCNYILHKHGLGEPTDEMVKTIFEEAEKFNYKRVIAVGGGTIIDIAKLMTHSDISKDINLYDLFTKKIPFNKNKELVIVPTTCGTGSEVTNISIVGFVEKNTKFGLAIEELYPDDAVLITELLKTLPFNPFITSSIDALIHSIESYLAPRSNPYTELYSLEAIKIILEGYLKILEKGKDYRNEIMNNFAIASNYAGIAFSNTGVGAVHAISYPLSGKYHVAHGEANYQFLTEVLRTYYKINSKGKIKELNAYISKILNIKEDAEVIYDKIDEILGGFLHKKKLSKYGMQQNEIDDFSKLVIETQQRLLNNNYVPFDKEIVSSVYKNLF
ncbi:4-hydroxybutyrate dehydrogenase [Clostridium pasteurianum]|uniref:Alcohol dehydrogenase, class IV n=1 Tax=Clostridium pasteurianum BC1 TaxID=86416 RepID=R4KGP1_CLOPA|nr:4-hydroxybutyrate dehydrogenase [Clostridium pasteurianum]AGK98775.1 alcohol dehydrogenase, class IV [Clostridium pasteurianum BC1]